MLKPCWQPGAKTLYTKQGQDKTDREWLRVRLMANAVEIAKSGCWEWRGYRSKLGYGKIGVAGQARNAHRVSYEVANNVKLTPSQLVCHRCDNPCCINPEHLFLGTYADNNRDCLQKGRRRKGAPNTQATPSRVRVRIMLAKGYSRRFIAGTLRITEAQVSSMVGM